MKGCIDCKFANEEIIRLKHEIRKLEAELTVYKSMTNTLIDENRQYKELCKEEG